MAQIIAGGNEPSNGGNTEILQRIQTANWNDLKGKPFITVSSKGIANGLSSIPNDGADFGPDTPGTKTSGIQEAKEALPHITNAASGRSVTVGSIVIMFKGYPIMITEPIVIYDDEFVEIRSYDGLTLPIQPPNKPIVYIENSTSGGDVIDISRNPNAPTTGSNLGNGVIVIDGITLSKSNTGVLLHSTSPSPNYSQLLIGTLHLHDSTYGNTLVNINTSGNDDLIKIDTIIGVGGTANSNSMFGANVNHLMVGKLFLLSYAGANPSGTSYSTMVSLVPGAECNFEMVDLFAYNNTAYPNGSFIINNSTFGGVVHISVLRDEMGGNNARSYFGSYGFFLQTSKPNYLYVDVLSGGTNIFTSPYGLENVFIGNNDSNRSAGAYAINKSPTIAANPPASGTVYQNTNPYDIRIYLPAYATTSGTAGSVAIALSSSSTPSTVGTKFVSGSTSSSATEIIELVVPAGWYYEFTASGVTFGTATVIAA